MCHEFVNRRHKSKGSIFLIDDFCINHHYSSKAEMKTNTEYLSISYSEKTRDRHANMIFQIMCQVSVTVLIFVLVNPFHSISTLSIK